MTNRPKPTQKSGPQATINRPPPRPSGLGVYGKYTPGRISQLVTTAKAAIPKTPAPKAPAAPTASQTPTAAPQQPAAPRDPRDAEYYRQMAKLEYTRDESIKDINLDEGYDSANLHKAIRLLQEQRPQDQTNAKESANKAGLFYSGQLGKQLGDIEVDYTRRQQDLQGDYDYRKSQRDLGRERAIRGVGLDGADLLGEAQGRATTRDAALADAGLFGPDGQPIDATQSLAQKLAGTGVLTPSGGLNWTVDGKTPPHIAAEFIRAQINKDHPGALTADGKLNWTVNGKPLPKKKKR